MTACVDDGDDGDGSGDGGSGESTSRFSRCTSEPER